MGLAAMFGGCVPSADSTVVEVNPDFQEKENVQLDFTQLHNETLEGLASIEEGQPFVFVNDIDISGDEGNKTITVKATALDGASDEDCESFAAALLCQMNDAAITQKPGYEESSADSFGTLYNDYSIDFTITDADNGETLYTLQVPAGDEIGLDPNYDSYVEDWLRERRIYEENLVYDVHGNIVRDGTE